MAEGWKTINGVPVLLDVGSLDSAREVYRAFGISPITFNQRSYTIPNASCPECGEPVFFYANDYGSRVFFDELGPPWPKHPCTDLNAESLEPKGARRGSRTKEQYLWEIDGWEPFNISKVKRLDGLRVEIEGRYIDSSETEVYTADDLKGANLGAIHCSTAVMVRAMSGKKRELSALGNEGEVILIDVIQN